MSEDRFRALESWKQSHDKEHEALERRLKDETTKSLTDAFEGMKRHVADAGKQTKQELEALKKETEAQTVTLAKQDTKLDTLVTNAEENAVERGRRKEREAEEAKRAKRRRQAERERDSEAERRLKQWQAWGIPLAIFGTVVTAIIARRC